MRGLIVIWSGKLATVPTGWHICDGTEGTPILKFRFIVGAGDTYNPGDFGGTINHQHSFVGDGHGHNFEIGKPSKPMAGDGWNETTKKAAGLGQTDLEYHRPPYMYLYFIMKL